MRLRLLVVALLTAPLLVGPAGAAAATSSVRPVVLEVTGAVDAPAGYRRDQLAALPQTTLTGRHHHVLTGVLLQTLVERAEPRLPAAKNAALRVSAVVTGRHHRAVATTLGELDPGFGNHPALLVLATDGRTGRGAPALVFPGDTDGARTVRHVRRVVVAVAPTAATDVPAGTLAVATERQIRTLPLSRLAALPQQTRTVTFLSGSEPQNRTETGPTLAAVLRLAHVRPGPASSVAATATDGYVAAVTPGEATSGGRPLLLSLVEDEVALTRPRLVPDGDVRGGRYVTDVTTLTVTRPSCDR